MENTKISFRISSEQKNCLIEEAKGSELTLTEYILWIFDMYKEFNSMSITQTIVGKSDEEVSEIIKDSENKFKAEFEKEISNAYAKGYQDGIKKIIKAKH